MRKKLRCPRGNSPTCPNCGNWNALLDKGSIREGRVFYCRDCGWEIKVDECIVIIIEAEKPGMGVGTVYKEVTRINGENF